jgi:hypothetical protein
VGDPAVLGVAQSAGTLNGGAHGPMPFVQRQQSWGRTPRTRRRDRLVVHARNLASATIDLRRARLSCAPQLVVRSDGTLTLGLPCASPLRTGRCGRAVSLTLPRVLGRRIVAARVSGRGRHTRTIGGHGLRRVVVRRTSRRAFSLRLDLRLSGRPSLRLIVSRRIAACHG